ncbi:MAG TPA: hypothetical protein VKR53_18305 [Puia sp.]|nr:hypothetical protein [Puia sp.]
MSNEKLSRIPFNTKSEYYAELEKSLILNISNVIDFIGLDWLQHWAPISFKDITTADQISGRKTNIELIALGLLFQYNLNHPEDPNVPYSPGVKYWTDHGDGTQSYHLFLIPPVTSQFQHGGGGGKGAPAGTSGGSSSVTPPSPPPPQPPY